MRLLADATAEASVFETQRWCWRRPGGACYARLLLPDPSLCEPDESLPLAFLSTADDSIATEFAGNTIWLGELKLTVAPSGTVDITPREIAEKCGCITLRVGIDRLEWPLDEATVTISPDEESNASQV
jgi:hypothetical protein